MAPIFGGGSADATPAEQVGPSSTAVGPSAVVQPKKAATGLTGQPDHTKDVIKHQKKNQEPNKKRSHGGPPQNKDGSASDVMSKPGTTKGSVKGGKPAKKAYPASKQTTPALPPDGAGKRLKKVCQDETAPPTIVKQAVGRPQEKTAAGAKEHLPPSRTTKISESVGPVQPEAVGTSTPPQSGLAYVEIEFRKDLAQRRAEREKLTERINEDQRERDRLLQRVGELEVRIKQHVGEREEQDKQIKSAEDAYTEFTQMTTNYLASFLRKKTE